MNINKHFFLTALKLYINILREKENNKQQRRGKKKTKPKDTNNIGHEKISWTKDSIRLFKKIKIKSPSPICCIRGGKTDKLLKKNIYSI